MSSVNSAKTRRTTSCAWRDATGAATTTRAGRRFRSAAIAVVSEILSSDGREFYRESHAKIYRAALGLYVKGEPVDAITLVDELERRGERARRIG